MPTPLLDTATDAALARRAGLGDAAAFEELFRRLFPSTFRYALHMLDGDDGLAQDATQEAWVKVWLHVREFEGRSQVRTWIFTIVAREVLGVRRRRRPVVVDHDALQALESARLDEWRLTASAEQGALDADLWTALTLALGELPWRQRASWLLFTVEGLTYVEIARVLDTTPTVVRGQLHRARRALEIRMEPWR